MFLGYNTVASHQRNQTSTEVSITAAHKPVHDTSNATRFLELLESLGSRLVL